MFQELDHRKELNYFNCPTHDNFVLNQNDPSRLVKYS